MASFKVLHEADREAWLKERSKRVGGSECAALVGLNPWMTNVELWEIKTGRRKRPDVGSSDLVIYGQKAEEHLRALFALDHPDLAVWHEPNAIITNDRYPFAHASVDGLLTKEDGTLGVLEIKTATITSGVQKAKWDGRVPLQYQCQTEWYMAITGAEFAILTAQLKWDTDGDVFKISKEYLIERADVQEDIDMLMEAGQRFRESIERDEAPALVLPRI